MRAFNWIKAVGLISLCTGCAEDRLENSRTSQEQVPAQEGDSIGLVDAKQMSNLFWKNTNDSSQAKIGDRITVAAGKDAAFQYVSEPKNFSDGQINFEILNSTGSGDVVALFMRAEGKHQLKISFQRNPDRSNENNSIVKITDEGPKKAREISCGTKIRNLSSGVLDGKYSITFSGPRVMIVHRYIDPSSKELTEHCTFRTALTKANPVSLAASGSFQFSLPTVIAAKPVSGPSTTPILRGPLGPVSAILEDNFLPRVPIDATISTNATEIEIEDSSRVSVTTDLVPVSSFLGDAAYNYFVFENGIERTMRIRQWFNGSVGAWSAPIKYTPVFATVPDQQTFNCAPYSGNLSDKATTDLIGLKCEMKILMKYKNKAEKIEKATCTINDEMYCRVQYTFSTPIERFQVLDANLSGPAPSGCSPRPFDGTYNLYAYIYKTTIAAPVFDCPE